MHLFFKQDYFSELMSELPKTIKFSLPSSQSLVEDFMLSRLPPFGINLTDLEDGPDGLPPKIDSSIKLAYPKHTTFCICEKPDGKIKHFVLEITYFFYV